MLIVRVNRSEIWDPQLHFRSSDIRDAGKAISRRKATQNSLRPPPLSARLKLWGTTVTGMWSRACPASCLEIQLLSSKGMLPDSASVALMRRVPGRSVSSVRQFDWSQCDSKALQLVFFVPTTVS